ncbi:hypothetical protein [Caudoviricetes sp.]|nr:hypothetical protein [Caudoviricetes sp.]UOF81120.1 hypothetical protein [Caudoviricetes sp.]UOF82244.1 hypothetical protein [Caudoviricetes sp.]UOF82465.1 hypothetical protein [Caudoviricetes sp.]UOF82619.1 hypothetical protein [Caudoviricetes sp.]
MTQHTPGPWQVESFNDDTACAMVFTVARGTDKPDEGYFVAIVSATSKDDPTARLIAAAPDLLAACQSAYEDCIMAISGEWEPDRDGFMATARILRAAIEKAKGE